MNRKKKHTPATKIDENLPHDLYTQASVALMNALALGQFEELESMLHEDVRTVCCESRTINGKTETLEYWKEWRRQYVETSNTADFEVMWSNYYSHACLRMSHSIIMFLIDGNSISTIVLTEVKSHRWADEDNKLNFPLDYERIKPYLKKMIKSADMANRMPCLQCGMESDRLDWYKSLLPYFYWHRDWVAGQVSVCPECARVVEYKYEGDIDKPRPSSRYNRCAGLRYPDDGNEFSEMADKIYPKTIIEGLSSKTQANFGTYLQSQLTDLELEQDSYLTLNLPEEKGIGDNSQIIVANRSGEERLDVVKHLRVKQTPMAAWQLYLLSRIETVLPYFWHGGYERRVFVFKASDIDDIAQLKYYDLSKLLHQNVLVPSVEIQEKKANGCKFVVRCCYWNDWEGLVRETVGITVEGDRVKDIRVLSQKVEFKYDCGILF